MKPTQPTPPMRGRTRPSFLEKCKRVAKKTFCVAVYAAHIVWAVTLFTFALLSAWPEGDPALENFGLWVVENARDITAILVASWVLMNAHEATNP